MENIVEFSKYSVKYSGQDFALLQEMDLSIKQGEILVMCGLSGSGKSTILQLIKEEIAPRVETSGKLSINVESKDIAIVFQNPDTQLFNSTVIADLTFGMENSGLDAATMKRYMSETVGYFGIEPLLYEKPSELSGGQKQICALCAALMMRPKLLLLDEPVSQLDPIAARDFIDMVRRVNLEFGVTIVIAEHRLDDVVAIADRIAVISDHKIAYQGEPRGVIEKIWQNEDSKASLFIPIISRGSLTIDNKEKICITPRELMNSAYIKPKNKVSSKEHKNDALSKPVVTIKNLVCGYKPGQPIIKNLDLTVYKGELLCLLGANGSGKSTLLKAIAGIVDYMFGSINTYNEKISYVPQRASSFFSAGTSYDELAAFGISSRQYADDLAKAFGINSMMSTHPYDLSAGEQQKLALVSSLASKSGIVLLDEPTKGMDLSARMMTINALKQSGATVILATHDIEFAAVFADRCAMLFDGEIAYDAHPEDFFAGNNFYTTSLNKALRNIDERIITYKDVLEAWGKKKPSFFPDCY